MQETIDLFLQELSNYAHYLWREITTWGEGNYFYTLIALSLLVYSLEVLLPWRKNQGRIRQDFWLDLFYLGFNFFLFSLIGFHAVSMVVVHWFNDALASIGINNLVAIEIDSWPGWTQLLLLFVLTDFIQFNIHRLLHRVPFLWHFHQIHHSVKEMGFAAHFRFHFAESIVYKSLQYIPIAMIGFGIKDFFIVHMIGVLIGHLNHANLNWGYGKLGYLFNNPKMHLWHHAKRLPEKHRHGVNFGLSLSIWDYLFKTAYQPHDHADLDLGFEGDEQVPKTFLQQCLYPFKSLRL